MSEVEVIENPCDVEGKHLLTIADREYCVSLDEVTTQVKNGALPEQEQSDYKAMLGHLKPAKRGGRKSAAEETE